MNKFFVICYLLFFASISSLFAQWEPKVNLTSNDSIQALCFPDAKCIATGPGGFVHVVWYDSRHWNNGYQEVYYRHSSDDGETWGPSTRLTYEYTNHQRDATIAVSDSIVHVAYHDVSDGGVHYMRSTDRGITWPWSADTCLTSSGMYPCIAASDSFVYVVYNGIYQGNVQICYMRSTDWGITWSQASPVTNSAGWFIGDASVAVSDLNLHVVWQDRRDPGRNIYYRGSQDCGVTWGPETRLSFLDLIVVHPCITVFDSLVHVVWDGSYEIYYRRSTDSGLSWETETTLVPHINISCFPSIACSGSNVHIAWQEGINNYEIYYKCSWDSGITWEPDVRLTNVTSWSRLPHIAVSDSAVHVVWEDNIDYNWEVYYKRNPTGNIGVQETDDRYQISDYRLKVLPNPFVSYTRILGYEQESFTLYDISGRVLGAYKGDRIGVDLSPGVYFLVSENKNTKPVRIVKVR